MPHDARECAECQLHSMLYGETFVNTETGEHYNPRTIVQTKTGDFKERQIL